MAPTSGKRDCFSHCFMRLDLQRALVQIRQKTDITQMGLVSSALMEKSWTLLPLGIHTIRPWRNCSGTFSCSANWRKRRDMVSKQLKGRCLTSAAVQLSGPALPAPLWALACNSIPDGNCKSACPSGVTCLSNASDLLSREGLRQVRFSQKSTQKS